MACRDKDPYSLALATARKMTNVIRYLQLSAMYVCLQVKSDKGDMIFACIVLTGRGRASVWFMVFETQSETQLYRDSFMNIIRNCRKSVRSILVDYSIMGLWCYKLI